jgi:hypothetical protein
MPNTFKLKATFSALSLAAVLSGCVAQAPARGPHHPAYLHALSDLRAARWLIEHRPGDWAQTADEREAVRQIDAGINDLKQAAYKDGKNVGDHPPVDEHPDHPGRIHEANAQGWRNRAIGHIDAAIGAARNVFHE